MTTLYTELLEEYKTAICEVWSSPKMQEYEVKKLSNLLKLQDGTIIDFEKPSIKKDFCFDDSFDYDGARRMAEHARTSADYFIRENMKELNELMEATKNAIEREKGNYNNNYSYSNRLYNCDIYYRRPHYTSQPENNPLGSISFFRLGRYEEEKDRATARGEECKYKKVELPDLERLLAIYQEEREKLKKRVDAYLKRYGLSKVNSWTYWGMA